MTSSSTLTIPVQELWKLSQEQPRRPLERGIVLGLVLVLLISFFMILLTR